MTLTLPEPLRCICGAELLCFWGRNGKRWNIHHPIRPNGDCQYRFHDFGHHWTEGLAWQIARVQLEDLTKTNT